MWKTACHMLLCFVACSLKRADLGKILWKKVLHTRYLIKIVSLYRYSEIFCIANTRYEILQISRYLVCQRRISNTCISNTTLVWKRENFSEAEVKKRKYKCFRSQPKHKCISRIEAYIGDYLRLERDIKFNFQNGRGKW